MANTLKAILILLATYGVAFASNTPLVFRLAYAVTTIVILCFLWSSRNIHALEIRRRPLELRTQVGKAIREVLYLRNRSLLPNLCVEIHDHSSLPEHQVGRAIALMPGGTKQQEIETTCRTRGIFTLGPYSVVTADPFGIFRWRRFFPQTWTVVVYPPTFDLPHFSLSTGQLAGGQLSRQRTQFVTPSAAAIREYAPGDGLNRIHWPSTAKMRHLMSKEFDLDPAPDVWIALDIQREVQVGSGAESTLEYGVAVAASLTKHLLDQHWAVGLIAVGAHRTVVQSDRGARQLLRTLEELASIRAEGTTPFAPVLTAEGTRFGRNTTLIAISPSAHESWVAALKDLAVRGVETMAIHLEARTFGPAAGSLPLTASLAAAGIPWFVVRRGDSIGEVLRL